MAAVDMNRETLKGAYRYANAIRNAAKRSYANAYIAWMVGGAVGLEPERGRLSTMAAQAVRLEVASLRLWG
jgi:hypothetical protein